MPSATKRNATQLDNDASTTRSAAISTKRGFRFTSLLLATSRANEVDSRKEYQLPSPRGRAFPTKARYGRQAVGDPGNIGGHRAGSGARGGVKGRCYQQMGRPSRW